MGDIWGNVGSFDTHSANPPSESNGVGTTSQNLTPFFFLVRIFFRRSFQIQLAINKYFHLISISVFRYSCKLGVMYGICLHSSCFNIHVCLS